MKRGQLTVVIITVILVALVGFIGLSGLSKAVNTGKATRSLPIITDVTKAVAVIQEQNTGKFYTRVVCEASCACTTVSYDYQGPTSFDLIKTSTTCGDCNAARASCQKQLEAECAKNCEKTVTWVDRTKGVKSGYILRSSEFTPPNGCQNLGAC